MNMIVDLKEVNRKIEEIMLFDSEGGKVTKSGEELTRHRQLIREVLEEDVPQFIEELEKVQKENQWLYGKLNSIGDIIEKGRKESEQFA